MPDPNWVPDVKEPEPEQLPDERRIPIRTRTEIHRKITAAELRTHARSKA